MGIARQGRLLVAYAKPQYFDWRHPWWRLRRVLVDGVLQRPMWKRCSWPGLAHIAIFLGFLVFVPRTLLLLARAFDPDFGLPVAGNDAPSFALLRLAYDWLKDTMAVVVLIGVFVFTTLRWRRFEARLEPKPFALGILGAIALMMLADLSYDASGIALVRLSSGVCGSMEAGTVEASGARIAFSFAAPFCQTDLSRLNPIMSALCGVLPANAAVLLLIGLVSYGLHLTLVGAFFVSLPHSKHFHLITVWPKLFTSDYSQGALTPVATSEQALCDLVEASLDRETAGSGGVPGNHHGADASWNQGVQRSVVGKESLADFSFAERLDLFVCTQCGRCTASCPAANTGKVLDPRRINQKLRKHLQNAPLGGPALKQHLLAPIVPDILEAEAVWACTNCGACEHACPVGVRFVASIVDLRRNLLLMRAEAPVELQRVFNAIEKNGNPYGFPQAERTTWTQGLAVPLLKDVPSVEYLFWVGCAASYDDRAKSIARSMVRLMRRAGVTFAILGLEERCTGDAARRAGNELLFLQLAERNIALLQRYHAEGRFRRIVTVCPHCLITLAQQYADLGGVFDVVSHVEAIALWIDQGRLVFESGDSSSEETLELTYHDPCNLARVARIVDEPRRILRVMGSECLLEPARHGENARCCGAGGSQMWLDESGNQRINEQRLAELSATQAQRIVTACPFCLNMLSEGAKNQPRNEAVALSDIAELVESRTRDALLPQRS